MKKPRALPFTNHVFSWTIQGMEFGYPPCCIGEFIIHTIKGTCKERGTRKLHGTGYVPCVKCDELSEGTLLATIEHLRTFKKAFPDDSE